MSQIVLTVVHFCWKKISETVENPTWQVVVLLPWARIFSRKLLVLCSYFYLLFVIVLVESRDLVHWLVVDTHIPTIVTNRLRSSFPFAHWAASDKQSFSPCRRLINLMRIETLDRFYNLLHQFFLCFQMMCNLWKV